MRLGGGGGQLLVGPSKAGFSLPTWGSVARLVCSCMQCGRRGGPADASGV